MQVEEQDLKVLSEFLRDVQLSVPHQDMLMSIWLNASSAEERNAIAQCYPRYFKDTAFIQRLVLRVQSRQARSTGQARQLTRQLRHEIDESVCKLAGRGPHPVFFGVVATQDQVKAAIDLFSSQFRYPESSDLQKLIAIPRNLSTRTRKKFHGNYTWYIGCETTNEMACAVTVTVHKLDTRCFIEVPLFATNSGYKRLGFARLMNAALQEHCCRIGCDFILVLADQDAVPFWLTPSIGYKHLPPHLKAIDFTAVLTTQFKDVDLLVWEAPKQLEVDLIAAGLQRAPQLALSQMSALPTL